MHVQLSNWFMVYLHNVISKPIFASQFQLMILDLNSHKIIPIPMEMMTSNGQRWRRNSHIGTERATTKIQKIFAFDIMFVGHEWLLKFCLSSDHQIGNESKTLSIKDCWLDTTILPDSLCCVMYPAPVATCMADWLLLTNKYRTMCTCSRLYLSGVVDMCVQHKRCTWLVVRTAPIEANGHLNILIHTIHHIIAQYMCIIKWI